jgi:hypothetical protein
MLGCGVYAGAIAMVSIAIHLFGSGSTDALVSQLRQGDADLRRAGEAADTARQSLAAVQRSLDMRHAAFERPDWSALLRVISGRSSPDVTLRDMQLDALAATSPTAQPRVSVVLRGSAPTQVAASQFTIRLQESGLFDTVELNRTGRDGSAVTFEVTCIATEEEVRR